MSYRLELNEPIADGIKRILHEQSDKALFSLKESHDILDERVHDARKRFKKIRAVMRLIRDDVGEAIYKRENKCYRDAGRQLADLRDTSVVIETLDLICEHYQDELAPTAFDEFREQLIAHNRSIRHRELTENAVIKVSASIYSARSRMDNLPIGNDGFDVFYDGLKRVYSRGYDGFSRAHDKPTPENFHEWRKRVKYLWYHMRILRMVWDDVQDEFADAIHDLANYLGDVHDLADFTRLIANSPDLEPEKSTAQALTGLANRWRKELEQSAYPLGMRVYAEKPKRFVKRMETYWQASQLEANCN